MSLFRITILSAIIIAPLSYAQAGDKVVDPSESGRSTQEVHAGKESSVSIPGSDGTVKETHTQTDTGTHVELDFDPVGNEVTGKDHSDTTVVYDKK